MKHLKMDTIEKDNAIAQARSILGPTKETEFLQSFVRVGTGDDEEETPAPKASISKRAPPSADKTSDAAAEEEDKSSSKEKNESKHIKFKRKQKKEKKKREEELYTDKDRAAAVVMGSRDLKHSLSMKDKADRSSALHLPAEADAGTLLGLARAEMCRERHYIAINFVNKVIHFYCHL